LFKAATFNANSIRARLDQVLAWLSREAPDVLCLQETKVQDKDFPLSPFVDAGYHVAFRGQKAHAGVALVSRTEPQDVSFGLDDGGEPDEPRIIRAVVRGIPVVNTYVPQGRDAESEHFQYKLEWLARVRSLFERHYNPADRLLWMGDLNVATEPIDVYDPKGLAGHVDFHPAAQAALEHVRAWGFVDVFRRHHPGEEGQYSYWDYRARNPIENGTGWRVDHIWATAPLARTSTASWIDVDARRATRPSDHTFLVAEFSS
jgi:exodeoxyribonuclease-3